MSDSQNGKPNRFDIPPGKPGPISSPMPDRKTAREYVDNAINDIQQQLHPACTFIFCVGARFCAPVEDGEPQVHLTTGGLIGRGGEQRPYREDFFLVLEAILKGICDCGQLEGEVLMFLDAAYATVKQRNGERPPEGKGDDGVEKGGVE